MTRPMTMATIVIAMGKEHNWDSIYANLVTRMRSTYIEDYKSFKPHEFQLMTSFMHAQKVMQIKDLEYISSSMPN